MFIWAQWFWPLHSRNLLLSGCWAKSPFKVKHLRRIAPLCLRSAPRSYSTAVQHSKYSCNNNFTLTAVMNIFKDSAVWLMPTVECSLPLLFRCSRIIMHLYDNGGVTVFWWCSVSTASLLVFLLSCLNPHLLVQHKAFSQNDISKWVSEISVEIYIWKIPWLSLIICCVCLSHMYIYFQAYSPLVFL